MERSMPLKLDARNWDKAYQIEKDNLSYYLRDFKVSINHYGATSILNGRSNRNVDILLCAFSLVDLSSVKVRLESKGYKLVQYEENPDYYVLVAPKKANGYGVSIRLMLYASQTYLRYNAFYLLLKENPELVIRYNNFREEITLKCGKNWRMYWKLKNNYINQVIDENFKFE